jgi:hypothetical protein
VAFGTTFGDEGKRHDRGHQNNVAAGLTEDLSYVKLKLELNYKISDFTWFYLSAGFLNSTNKYERLNIYSDYADVYRYPDSKDLSINTQVPFNRLFYFNGMSCSFGIIFRGVDR